MTPRDFNASIRSTYHFLEECKILRSATAFRTMEASGEFRELALVSTTPYRNVFLCGLRNGDYNFLLKDYAYFQFTFGEKDRYRFAYYPNPFAIGEEGLHEMDALLEQGVISFEEYSDLLSEQPYEVTKPAIRFELDCNAYVRLSHPAAHFHIGMHSENRWPVCRRLTPRSFALMIVKLYYGDKWGTGRLDRELEGFINRFDYYFVAEKRKCDQLGHDLFHAQERDQMHLA